MIAIPGQRCEDPEHRGRNDPHTLVSGHRFGLAGRICEACDFRRKTGNRAQTRGCLSSGLGWVLCQDPEHGERRRTPLDQGALGRYRGDPFGLPGLRICVSCYQRRRGANRRRRTERRKGPASCQQPQVTTLPEGPLPRPTNQSTRPAPGPYRDPQGTSFDALTPEVACRRIRAIWGTPEAALILTAERRGKVHDLGDDE